ncbi:hypothetical protein [Cryptosporangium minutisporangium]|uniref:Uncharacterized protein n=1 Tax=Cryptosporangium minutisporangium TaxID=113569 RepID=A0ABP6T9V4_9ACTN
MTEPTGNADQERRWIDGDLESGADPTGPAESTQASEATATRPTDTGRGEQPDLQPAEGTITEE